jgi:hypothetical protein
VMNALIHLKVEVKHCTGTVLAKAVVVVVAAAAVELAVAVAVAATVGKY